MPPVFGPGSPSSQALVVLARSRAAATCAPSAITMKLASSPSQELLDHDARAGRAERVAGEHRVDARRCASATRRRDDHALARGQAVGLDDDRRAAARARTRASSVASRERRVGARSGCRGARRKSLANAFEPSSCAAARVGPKSAGPRARNASTTPATSGAFGPDDGERRRFSRCASATSAGDVVGGDVDVAHLRLARGAGVAGRDEHLATRAATARASTPARARGRRRRRQDLHRRTSVPEVAHAGEHHRDAVLVGGGDHLVVAHRAARLDHRA